jgi:hypothetical protein
MQRRLVVLDWCVALFVASACGPVTPPATPGPERIVAIEPDGRVLRQSTTDEMAEMAFSAPIDRVWPALQLSYADLGIEPTVADRAKGLYGNGGFLMPRKILGHPIGEYFRCGYGMAGPLIDQGRLNATVLTTITATAASVTTASTRVSALLIRNDGVSSDPLRCASTGKLEEALRTGVEKRLTGAP